jgi:lipase chaperone LimK
VCARAKKELNVGEQSKRQIVVLSVCALGVITAAMWGMAGEEGEPVAPGTVVQRESSETRVAKPDQRPKSSSDSSGIVIDIGGTQFDAARLFDLGFAGGLNIDQETRSTLDTLLIAVPDETSAQDTEKLERSLRNGLPKDDAEKAIKLFQGYRAYLADMKIEGEQLGIPETPAATDAYFDKLAQIQRRHFDAATAAGLFGQENMNARLTMQASFVSNDPALSLGEKKERLQALRAQLPAELHRLIPEPEAAPAQQ